MTLCGRCGRTNPFSVSICVGCGIPIGEAPYDGRTREVEHVDYLLGEIPAWSARGWVPMECAERLTREYMQKRAQLRQPVVPPVYTAAQREASAQAARVPNADSWKPSRPVAAANGVAGMNATRAVVVPAPNPPRAPWLAEFLEAHWMKLLALLAGILIMVGMRQILGWEWVGTLAIMLVPLLPIGLTATFYYCGMRARKEEPFGAFAYCAVAIVLAAFSLFSINKHWLGGSLPQPWAITLGAGISTVMAAWTLYKTDDLRFLHMLLGGASATVYTLLLANSPAPFYAPGPVWLFGAAFLSLALLYLLTAWRLRESDSSDERSNEAAFALMIWAHLSTTAALARAAVPGLAGSGLPHEAAALFAASAILYAASAQWFASSELTYVGGAMALSFAGLLLFQQGRLDWYPAGTAAFVLSLGALGISVLNRLGDRDSEQARVAEAYHHLALLTAGLAGAALLGRVLAAGLGLSVSLNGADWTESAALAARCALLYTLLAVYAEQPTLLYAACASSAISLNLLTHRLLPVKGLVAPWLSHDLIPFALLSLGLGLALRRDENLKPWSRPLLDSAALVVGTGLIVSLIGGIDGGGTPALWRTLLPYTALCIAGAVTLTDDSRVVAQGWAAAAMTAITACAAFLAAPAVAREPLAAGTMLILSGCGWLGFALALRQVRADHVWLPVLRAGIAISALAGAMLVGTAPADDALWMTAAFALAFGVFVIQSLLERSVGQAAGGFAIVLLASVRLWMAGAAASPSAAPLLLVVFTLGAAATYGLLAYRLEQTDLVWLAGASVGIAGAAGAVLGGTASATALATAIVSAVGLAAVAIGFGLAAGWARRPAFCHAAGVFALAAYLRSITLIVLPGAAWLAMLLLPAIVVMAIAAHLLASRDESLYTRPLQTVALLSAYAALAVSATTISSIGTSATYPTVLNFLCYAAVFSLATHSEATHEGRLSVSSAVMLILGWVFALGVPPRGAHGQILSWMLALVSGLCAGNYVRIALRNADSAYGYAAAGTICAAWFAAMVRIIGLPAIWWSLGGLPCLISLWTAGHSMRDRHDGSLGAPFRQAAAGFGLAASALVILMGIDRLVATSWIVTGTLAAYGAAFLVGAGLRRSATLTACGSAILTTSFGYRLASIGLTPPEWSCRFVWAAAIWLLAARLLESRSDTERLAVPTYNLSAITAALAGVIGAMYVNMPHQGMYTLLTLAVAGSVYSGLFLFGRGEGYAHLGFVSYEIAYALFLYDRIHLNVAVIDLYLIPAGLYLALLGHIAGRRGQDDNAAALWWLGLLTTLGPTFASFYSNHVIGGSPLHAALLLIECVGAVAWGIAHRLKAFVFAGMLFALAFSVVMGAGKVVEVWSGLFAVTLGVGLLAFVFYLSLHQDAIRRWMLRVEQEWQRWK